MSSALPNDLNTRQVHNDDHRSKDELGHGSTIPPHEQRLQHALKQAIKEQQAQRQAPTPASRQVGHIAHASNAVPMEYEQHDPIQQAPLRQVNIKDVRPQASHRNAPAPMPAAASQAQAHQASAKSLHHVDYHNQHTHLQHNPVEGLTEHEARQHLFALQRKMQKIRNELDFLEILANFWPIGNMENRVSKLEHTWFLLDREYKLGANAVMMGSLAS